MPVEQALHAARKALAQAGNIAVLTGAGVSADSGVPIFRGPGGLWENHRPEELATPRPLPPTLNWSGVGMHGGEGLSRTAVPMRPTWPWPALRTEHLNTPCLLKTSMACMVWRVAKMFWSFTEVSGVCVVVHAAPRSRIVGSICHHCQNVANVKACCGLGWCGSVKAWINPSCKKPGKRPNNVR